MDPDPDSMFASVVSITTHKVIWQVTGCLPVRNALLSQPAPVALALATACGGPILEGVGEPAWVSSLFWSQPGFHLGFGAVGRGMS